MASNSILILAFHRVSDEYSPAYPPIPVKVFDKVCGYLKKNFDIIHPNQLLDDRPSKKRKVLITFDDAYSDFMEEAYPILKKYNLPVLQHIITHCADTGESFWTQRLNKTLEAFLKEKRTIEVPSIAIYEPKLTPSNIEQIALTCYRKMLPLKSNEREEIIVTLRSQLQDKVTETRMLKWMDLADLEKDKNVVLGLHTHTHKNLTTLSEEEILEELNQSKVLFEKHLKSDGLLFLAYPNGQYNNLVINCAQKTGIDVAFTCENSCYLPDKYKSLEVPRFLMYHKTWLKNWLHLKRINFLKS